MIKTPDINHKKDQNADFSAFLLSCLCFLCFWYAISHIYAHKKGHHNNPINPNGQITIQSSGNTIIHTNNQIVLQLIHRFVHHIFFVQKIGII